MTPFSLISKDKLDIQEKVSQSLERFKLISLVILSTQLYCTYEKYFTEIKERKATM